jgi:hypothetical protein
MDPHGGRVLGFLFGFRVVANHRLLQDSNPWIVTQRGTVAVDFRVHPNLDELRLLPVTHVFELPEGLFTPCGQPEATIGIDASADIVEVSKRKL